MAQFIMAQYFMIQFFSNDKGKYTKLTSKTILNLTEREINSNYENHEIYVLAFGLKHTSTCDLLT